MMSSKAAKKRQTDPAEKERRAKSNLAQFGLLDVPNVSGLSLDHMEDDDEDDAALEAELLALTGGERPVQPKRAKRAMVAPEQLDKMVSDCMTDDYDDLRC